MGSVKKIAMGCLLTVALCQAVSAQWEQSPRLSLEAEQKGDQVTVTIYLNECDPLAGMQFSLVYDPQVLTAVGKPKLADPWASMLGATNVPNPGEAIVAVVTMAPDQVDQGAVATMEFTCNEDAADTAYFYLNKVELSKDDRTVLSQERTAMIALDLEDEHTSVGGGSSQPVDKAPILSWEQRLAQVTILQANNYAAVRNGVLTHVDLENKAVMAYVNEDERTMVPIRFVAESLGAEVEWIDGKNQVALTQGENQVVMTIGQTTYLYNGEERTMDTAPVLNLDWGRTLVPVRFVAEALGADVHWVPESELVIITNASAPWNMDGIAEQQAMIKAQSLMAPLVRDFVKGVEPQ